LCLPEAENTNDLMEVADGTATMEEAVDKDAWKKKNNAAK
jgi:hypothetical protein